MLRTLLLVSMIGSAMVAYADELAKEAPKDPAPKTGTFEPIPVKDGEVYRIENGKPVPVDMTLFQVQSIEWMQSWNDRTGQRSDIGLRSDGVVVWRRAAK